MSAEITISFSADTQLLQSVEALLARRQRWEVLLDVSERHLAIDNALVPALWRYRSLVHLGDVTGADAAAAALVEQFANSDSRSLRHMVSVFARYGSGLELTRLRVQQWRDNPANAASRQRLMAATRVALDRGHSAAVIGLLAFEIANDAALQVRLIGLLKRAGDLRSVVELRMLQWCAEPTLPGRRNGLLGALRMALDAGQTGVVAQALIGKMSKDRGLVDRALKWLADAGHCREVVEVCCRFWQADTASPSARRQLLRVVHQAIDRGQGEPAVAGLCDASIKDALVVKSVIRWLQETGQKQSMAALRERQARSLGLRPRDLLKWVEALVDAGELGQEHPAVACCIAAARQSDSFLEVLRTRAVHWSLPWLLTKVRLLQIERDPAKYGLVPLQLAWLKGAKETADGVGRFLDAVAGIEGLAADDSQALRRLLLKHGRHGALLDRLMRELKTTPDDIALRLELSVALELSGDTDAFLTTLEEVRRQLLAGNITDLGARDLDRAKIIWIRGQGSSELASRIEEPAFAKPPRLAPLVEHLAARTQALGESDIWEGYTAHDIKSEKRTRAPNDIRVSRRVAVYLATLARTLHPRLILEVGAGFGVSGMYWMSGLEEGGGDGRFISFEPNPKWQCLAAWNYARVSDRGTVKLGTFEDLVTDGSVLPGSVDILSIDAIHTREAVRSQIKAALPLLSPDALVLIDDIKFSPEMHLYWQQLAAQALAMSFVIDGRVGALQGVSLGTLGE